MGLVSIHLWASLCVITVLAQIDQLMGKMICQTKSLGKMISRSRWKMHLNMSRKAIGSHPKLGCSSSEYNQPLNILGTDYNPPEAPEKKKNPRENKPKEKPKRYNKYGDEIMD